MSRDLIIALHGTRHSAGLEFAHQLRAEVADRLGGVAVDLGWVDVHEERLGDVVRRHGPSVIVPAFLTAGYHVEHDIAQAVAASAGRATATAHLGGELLDAVHQRLIEAGELGDAVLLASIGSARVGSNAEVYALASRLAQRVGRPVEVGFVYAAQPALDEALNRLTARGLRDVTVATHVLAPGRYGAHLAKLDVRAIAEPIGVHPQLVATIVTRYANVIASEAAA